MFLFTYQGKAKFFTSVAISFFEIENVFGWEMKQPHQKRDKIEWELIQRRYRLCLW